MRRDKTARLEAYYLEYVEDRKRGLTHEALFTDYETWMCPIVRAQLSRLIKSRGPR